MCVMVKTKKILFSALALAVLLAGGCQKDEKSSGKAEIYYSAIESGDYYEGWANNLKGQAEKYLLLFTGHLLVRLTPNKKHRAFARCGKTDKISLTSKLDACFYPFFPAP